VLGAWRCRLGTAGPAGQRAATMSASVAAAALHQRAPECLEHPRECTQVTRHEGAQHERRWRAAACVRARLCSGTHAVFEAPAGSAALCCTLRTDYFRRAIRHPSWFLLRWVLLRSCARARAGTHAGRILLSAPATGACGTACWLPHGCPPFLPQGNMWLCPSLGARA
jgi:hypothetical protein